MCINDSEKWPVWNTIQHLRPCGERKSERKRGWVGTRRRVFLSSFSFFFLQEVECVSSVRMLHHSVLCGRIDHSILNMNWSFGLSPNNLVCFQACKSEPEVCRIRWFRSSAFHFGVLNVIWLLLGNMVSHAEMCVVYCFVLLSSQQQLDVIFDRRTQSNVY